MSESENDVLSYLQRVSARGLIRSILVVIKIWLDANGNNPKADVVRSLFLVVVNHYRQTDEKISLN